MDRPFTQAKRHEGDEAYAFFTHFTWGGEHEEFTLTHDEAGRPALSGSLADWIAARGRENFQLATIDLTLVVSITEEDLALEFRLTFC